MAKSKNGGSRAYIRGRIGSDVYSVGKTGSGAKQQVVRSLAEQVSNPRTESQMFGRMVMSTVMQAVSALKPIIDHSFDSLPSGQPSISEFIRRNYYLVKNDANEHPSTGNVFGLNQYQEKGVKPGHYVVSDGSAVKPAALIVDAGDFDIQLTETTLTVGGLKAALGLSADGYITAVGIGSDVGARFARLKLATTLSDETAITSENVASLFTVEANYDVQISLTNNFIVISMMGSGDNGAYGWIVSDLIDGSWKHNQCVLEGEGEYSYRANVALPTYPTGVQQFLNGGDL